MKIEISSEQKTIEIKSPLTVKEVGNLIHALLNSKLVNDDWLMVFGNEIKPETVIRYNYDS